MSDYIPTVSVARQILLIRGQKVMIDTDLAELYGIETKALNQAVKRNKKRFPTDFMFQLTEEEKKMWSQIVTTYPVSNSLQPYPMFLRNMEP